MCAPSHARAAPKRHTVTLLRWWRAYHRPMSAAQTAIEALGVAVAARVPVLVWGAPGTGKTSAIRAMALEMDLACETVIASIREPSDFAGLPVVHDGQVVFAPPRWASRLAQEERGILFLDEISTAPPAVQAALLRVVLERVVGDLALPDGIVVIAAANPPEMAADGWDLSAPLANRFCHVDWPVEAQAFAEGLSGGWGAPPVPHLPGVGGGPGWRRGPPPRPPPPGRLEIEASDRPRPRGRVRPRAARADGEHAGGRHQRGGGMAVPAQRGDGFPPVDCRLHLGSLSP